MDSKHTRAVVVSRQDITQELWIVRLRPEDPLVFQAGQYLTVGLPADDKLVERPYSVVSSPREQELEFFLELVPKGELTPHLYNVPVGGEVLIRRAAKGRFTFDRASGHRNHLLVATVTGVAPYVSMVREFATCAEAGEKIPYQVSVLHAASLSSELAYADELAALAKNHSWLSYIPTVSRIWLDQGWQGEMGRAEDVIRKYLDTLRFTAADATVYVCGNPDMISNVKGVLKRAGFAKESVKEEVYWVPDK